VRTDAPRIRSAVEPRAAYDDEVATRRPFQRCHRLDNDVDALLGIDPSDDSDDRQVGLRAEACPYRRIGRSGMESLRVDGLRYDMKSSLGHTAVVTDRIGDRLADGHHPRGGGDRRLQHPPSETRADEVVKLQYDRTMGQPTTECTVQVAPQAIGVDHVHLPRSAGDTERTSACGSHLSGQCRWARATSRAVPEPLMGRKLQFDVRQARRSPRVEEIAVTRRTERQLDSPGHEQTSETEDAPLGAPHDS
jgi:hypothetical protein